MINSNNITIDHTNLSGDLSSFINNSESVTLSQIHPYSDVSEYRVAVAKAKEYLDSKEYARVVCEKSSIDNDSLLLVPVILIKQAGKVLVQSYSNRYPTVESRPVLGGNHQVGDLVYNTDVSNNKCLGWICIEEGIPGTWKEVGQARSWYNEIETLDYLPQPSELQLGRQILLNENNNSSLWICKLVGNSYKWTQQDYQVGTTADRPTNPTEGYIRYNTDENTFEFWTKIYGWVHLLSSAMIVSLINEPINELSENIGNTISKIDKLIYQDMEQSEIQSILSSGGNVLFTRGHYGVSLGSDNTGFSLSSNTTISFDDGVVVAMSASNKEGYQLFSLKDIENVSISGYATIVGDKDIHVGTTGEWGHCFKIEGCKNITLEKMTIKKFWGDGIYIGESSNSQNENIIINNVVNEDNRRQGISVITCDGLTINDCVCKDIKGINPQAGIDIEPNNNRNVIKNVNINNLRTYNCAGSGLCVSVARIGEGSDVSITVNNHYDYRSTNSLLVFNNASVKMQGLITINDSYYDMQGINNCINIVATTSLAPKLLINRPRIYMSSAINNTTASPSKNAIAIWQPYESNEKMGNVDIVEPYLFGQGRVEGYIYVRNDLNRENVEKIHIIKPRKQVVAGATSINLQIPNYANDIFVDLDTNDFNLNIDYDCTLHNHMQRKYILSSSAKANRTVALQLAPYGYECEFQNDSLTWNLIGKVDDLFEIIVPPSGYAKLKHKGEGNWEVLHKNFDLPVSYDGPPIVVLTKSEYDELASIDNNTLYFIKE